MDIGAFMQAFSGESTLPKGNSTIDKAQIMNGGQSSSDRAADHGTTPFIQAIRQILDKGDSGGPANEEGNQTILSPSGDMTQAMLLLEWLGQAGIGERYLEDEAKQARGADGAEADLLVMLNEQLAELETTLNQVSANASEIETDLFTWLNQRMSASAPSIPESATSISGDSQNDSDETVPLLKSVWVQRVGQDQSQPVQGKNGIPETATDVNAQTQGKAVPDDAIAGDQTATNLQDRMAGMVSDSSNDAIDLLRESVDKKILDDAENTSLAQEGADASDGKLTSAKSLVQALMSQRNGTQSRQGSDQPPSAQGDDDSQSLEWVGLKKESLQGQSTLTEPAQTTASPKGQGELLFAGEKQGVNQARHHQVMESESTKSTLKEFGQPDTLLNDSGKVAASIDSPMDNRPVSTATTGKASMPSSGDTAFQKAVMDQIVEKATLRSVNDRSEMRIQLKPESLGEVRMSIVAEKNHLVVQMVADRSETKEIIESQIHHLKAELDKQGLTVGKLEVMISAGNDPQDSREQFFQMSKHDSDGNGKRQRGGAQQESTSQPTHSEEKRSDSSGDGINYFV